MTNEPDRPIRLRVFMALLGMINCLGVSLLFGSMQLDVGQSVWSLFPQPGLYLLEITLLGILGFVATLRSWPKVLWAITGILTTFVILGIWSLGFYLVPVTLIFGIISFISSKQIPFLTNFSFFIGAALVQAVLMLIPFVQ